MSGDSGHNTSSLESDSTGEAAEERWDPVQAGPGSRDAGNNGARDYTDGASGKEQRGKQPDNEQAVLRPKEVYCRIYIGLISRGVTKTTPLDSPSRPPY